MKKSKIIYFANPNSPHLIRWLEVLKLDKYDVEIVTVHKPLKDIGVKVHYILPDWMMKFGIINYVVGGVVSKFFLRGRDFDILHAHNSSGYGLMAYLSGYEYIVTTYGTEIYESNSRGRVYTYLIKLILDKATKITATSLKMKNELQTKFRVKAEKIHLFSLGVNTDIFYKKKYDSEDKNNWIINRRVTPLYNTKEVVEGFVKFKKNSNNDVNLTVICGDYDRNYLSEIKKNIDVEMLSSVVFIEKFLTQVELASFLSMSEYSISVPKSDQLSASILESLASETIPILSDLEAYNILKENSVAIFVKNYSSADFYNIFNYIYNLDDNSKKIYIDNAKKYISKFESNSSLIESINILYTKQSNK